MAELKSDNYHIIIVEPNFHFGEAIKNFLAANLMCKSIQVFASSEALHDDIPIPDFLIIDTSILQNGDKTSLQVYTYLNPGVVSIAISIHNGIPSLSELIRLGFKGYISKRNIYTQLIPVIRTTLNGEYNFKDHSNN